MIKSTWGRVMSAAARTLLATGAVCWWAASVEAENSLYWGDVHLHTNLSFDAYINGTRAVGPQLAYKFAQGKAVVSNTGLTVQRKRPLDFLAITDHSENMGFYTRIESGDPRVLGTTLAQRYTELQLGSYCAKKLVARSRFRPKLARLLLCART